MGGRHSGWGDLLGGVVIVLRRVEVGEYHIGEVPLTLFQGRIFKEKEYLDRTAEVVLEGIDALKIRKNEYIHVCEGYILSRAREELSKQGFKIVSTKIAGATQKLAETEFIRTLVRLGIGNEVTVAGMRSFKSFLRWVLEDLEHREHFVKTGWSSWPRLKTEGAL